MGEYGAPAVLLSRGRIVVRDLGPGGGFGPPAPQLGPLEGDLHPVTPAGLHQSDASTSPSVRSLASRRLVGSIRTPGGVSPRNGPVDPEAAARAQSVTAVDAAAEVLALARARTASPTVQFLEADLFEWQPPRRYDTVFFAFWLSHVPPTRLPDFWNTVATALAPGGKAIFIDDGPAAAAEETILANQPASAALHRLDDGSQNRIVKVFHDVQTLTDDWGGHGANFSSPPSP